MNPDTIQFQCGFCRTVLTVPIQMAGVTGPCPSCGQTVTSPTPERLPPTAQPPQWNQQPAPEPAAAPMIGGFPPHGAAQVAPHGGMGGTFAPQDSGTGLPPRRPPGQFPLTSSLGESTPVSQGLKGAFSGQSPMPGTNIPSLTSNESAFPSQSRMIPGSPALPSMSSSPGFGDAGMSGSGAASPTGSLLGRNNLSSISPTAQSLQPPGMAPLNLGNALGPQGRDSPSVTAPVSPLPPGRSVASLRTPPGTNFIRLAMAAIFLMGFLGLVGYLLRDTLVGFFPALAGELASGELASEETPETDADRPNRVPAAKPDENARIPSSETVPQEDSSKTTPPISSVATAAFGQPQMPSISGFDPAEPAPLKALPATADELSKTGAGPSPNSIVETPPSGTQPTIQESKTALLEVPNDTLTEKMAEAGSNPARPSPSSSLDDDNAPPEAKPAVQALKQFLGASSLDVRLQHTLGAEHMKPLMERYYARAGDGPIVVDHIEFIRMDPNPELGSGKHCIFSIENKAWEFPVPVMLEEQPDGFKVDWLAFVEFKDRLLEKFFQSYQEGPARFHVGIIRHHYFEDKVPNVDRKYAFRVSPAPPNSFQASVFLDKESNLAQELRVRLPWETHVWAVVELEWKKLGTQQWVELSAVPQMHWYSLPVAPRPISTPQKTTETELPPGISKNGVSGSSSNIPPPGISKSSPDLPPTLKRPLPAGR